MFTCPAKTTCPCSPPRSSRLVLARALRKNRVVTTRKQVMTIHRVETPEWEVLRDIRLRALADSPDAFGSTLERELAFDEAMWRSRCVTSTSYLAECDGVTCGLVAAFCPTGDSTETERSSLELVSMWVAPQYRRRGIAAQLVNEVLELARREHAESVTLWVAEGNGAAGALYERLGFVRTGKTDGLPGRPEKCEELLRFQVA
jgi:ribosomal protein S18 acetylase RimI-like enzyme